MAANQAVESELKPQPMEGLFRDSSNDALRNIAINILALKKDAGDRLWHGATKLSMSGIVAAASIKILNRSDFYTNYDAMIALFIAASLTGGLFASGLVDIVKSFNSRGESNTLTTVLAAEAIAQSKQNQPTP